MFWKITLRSINALVKFIYTSQELLGNNFALQHVATLNKVVIKGFLFWVPWLLGSLVCFVAYSRRHYNVVVHKKIMGAF